MIRLNQPEDIKKTSELCPDTASRRKKIEEIIKDHFLYASNDFAPLDQFFFL